MEGEKVDEKVEEKSASSVSIIGGADGPTSFFIAGRQKLSMKHKIQRIIFRIRKAWTTKNIKAEPHTINEVISYIKDKYGFEEMDHADEEYQEQYTQMRSSSIMQYAPELLGKYSTSPKLTTRDEEGIKMFMKQNELRQRAAESISQEVFDVDLHILKAESADIQIEFLVESRYGYIGGGFSGPNNAGKRQYEKMYRDVYRYYGVSGEDIDNKTKRYENLVRVLARR